MIEADPGAALHTDRVHSVHEASVLEVITVSVHLQPAAGEAAALVKHDLRSAGAQERGQTTDTARGLLFNPKSSRYTNNLLKTSLLNCECHIKMTEILQTKVITVTLT